MARVYVKNKSNGTTYVYESENYLIPHFCIYTHKNLPLQKKRISGIRRWLH